MSNTTVIAARIYKDKIIPNYGCLCAWLSFRNGRLSAVGNFVSVRMFVFMSHAFVCALISVIF